MGGKRSEELTVVSSIVVGKGVQECKIHPRRGRK